MKLNNYTLIWITTTSLFLLFVSIFINFYQYKVYKKNTEIIIKNQETYKKSAENLKKQLELKTQNILDLEFYKKIVNQLEKWKIEELKQKIENIDKEIKKELFDENWEIRKDLSFEDYNIINSMLKWNNSRISLNTKLDYSFRAPRKKEWNVDISLNNAYWLEQIIQNNKEWVNIINLKFDIWNWTSKLTFTPVNLFLFSMFKELDDKSFTNLLSKILRDEDSLNIMTSINKDFDNWNWFNFLKWQSQNIKRLYKFANENWVSNQKLSEIMISNLENFDFDEKRVFIK